MKENIELYFSLFRGSKVLKSTLERHAQSTIPIVESLLGEGKLVGQYTLPFGNKEDILIWDPSKQPTPD